MFLMFTERISRMASLHQDAPPDYDKFSDDLIVPWMNPTYWSFWKGNPRNNWFGVPQFWRNAYAIHIHSPTFWEFALAVQVCAWLELKPSGFKSCYRTPYAEVVVQSAEKNAVELNAAQIGTDALLLSLLTVSCSFEADGSGGGHLNMSHILGELQDFWFPKKIGVLLNHQFY